MAYSKEEYISDLFSELRENKNFKNKVLKQIVDVSENINMFLSNRPDSYEKTADLIALRVFEIIALGYYDENLTKNDIAGVISKILNSEVANLFNTEKTKIKSTFTRVKKKINEDIQETKDTIKTKVMEYDNTSSINLSALIFEIIGEYKKAEYTESAEIDYRENYEDDLISKQDRLKNSMLNSAFEKIFVQSLNDNIFKEIVDVFYQDNINNRKYDGKTNFSLVKQVIFSEIFFYLDSKITNTTNKKLFYSKYEISVFSKSLSKNKDVLYDESNIEEIFYDILEKIGEINSPTLKKYFEKRLKEDIGNIYNSFLTDIKLQEAYTYNSEKSEETLKESGKLIIGENGKLVLDETELEKLHKNNKTENTSKNDCELIMGKGGNLVYNYGNTFDKKNILLFDDVEKVKKTVSVLAPSIHNYEVNILKFINSLNKKTSHKDYNTFFEYALKDENKFEMIFQFTNSIQALSVLNNFHKYLQKEKKAEKSELYFDKIVEIYVSYYFSRNIGSNEEDIEDSFGRKINLALFYLGYGVGNNGLEKLYHKNRINSSFEEILIKNIKTKPEILDGYNVFLKRYLNTNNSILDDSFKKESKLYKSDTIINPGKRKIFKVVQNPLKYLNIYYVKEDLIKHIKLNIKDSKLQAILIEYINDEFEFDDIHKRSSIGIISRSSLTFAHNRILKNILISYEALVFGLYIMKHFDYLSDVVFEEEIRRIYLKEGKNTNEIKKIIETKMQELLDIKYEELSRKKEGKKTENDKIYEKSRKNIDKILKDDII